MTSPCDISYVEELGGQSHLGVNNVYISFNFSTVVDDERLFNIFPIL